MDREEQRLEQVRLHRRAWPLDRIRGDPAGFRADCERLLIGFPSPGEPEAGAGFPLAAHWLDLLFSDPPEPPKGRIRDQILKS